MNKLSKLLACLRELNFKPKLDNFEDRLKIQKTACLLELMGFGIGYNFSLYVRGPYSPDLTHDLYANKEAVHETKSSEHVSASHKDQLLRLSEASDALNPTMLEIMSTYAFLVQREGKGEMDAIIRLKKLKPFFSEAQIAIGVSRAKQLFLPGEDEIKRMKEEFKAWENASAHDKN